MSLKDQRKANWKLINNDFSNTEIANYANISVNTLYNFVQCERSLSVDTLVKISEKVNHSLEFLLGLREIDTYDANGFITSDKNKIKVARHHMEDLNYRNLPFRNELGLKVAKKLLRLTDLELEEVDKLIDFLTYRKKLRLGRIEQEED